MKTWRQLDWHRPAQKIFFETGTAEHHIERPLTRDVQEGKNSRRLDERRRPFDTEDEAGILHR